MAVPGAAAHVSCFFRAAVLVPSVDRTCRDVFSQTFASVGKVLHAVVAPLVIAELQADPAWVGVDEAKGFMSKNGVPLTIFEQCQDGQKV